MHLGHIDGSFVPHNLTSTQENTVPLLQFQMAPRVKILMSSGSKATKRNPHILSFTLKNPSRRTPSGSREGPLRRKITVYRAFCVSLETLIKISLNKKALRKKRPSKFPKSGPLWKQTSISEPYLTYFTGSRVKGPSLQVPFMESPAERYPVPTALLHSSFKVPGV